MGCISIFKQELVSHSNSLSLINLKEDVAPGMEMILTVISVVNLFMFGKSCRILEFTCKCLHLVLHAFLTFFILFLIVGMFCWILEPWSKMFRDLMLQ